MIEKSSPESSQEQSDEKQSEPQQTTDQQPNEQPNNWEADNLLRQSFAQPVRFITYSGIKDLSKIGTKPYALRGVDVNGDKIVLAKLDILFAFPKEKMPILKPHVKIRKPLKAQNLEPIHSPEDRFHVADELLAEVKENASTMSIVTRAGYVLNGRIEHFDKYVLYMCIGEEVVVVYRHGLFSFTVET